MKLTKKYLKLMIKEALESKLNIPKDKLLGVEVWKNDESKKDGFFSYKMVYFLGGNKFLLFADYENNKRPLIQKEMIKSIYRMKFDHNTEKYIKGEILYIQKYK